MKGMVALRQTLEELIAYQLEDYPSDAISAKQQELNTAYDAFSAKYGLINDRANVKLFDQDGSYYLLCSLENLDENGALKSKADIFTKRTIRPTKAITSADTPSEATGNFHWGTMGRWIFPICRSCWARRGNMSRSFRRFMA